MNKHWKLQQGAPEAKAGKQTQYRNPSTVLHVVLLCPQITTTAPTVFFFGGGLSLAITCFFPPFFACVCVVCVCVRACVRACVSLLTILLSLWLCPFLDVASNVLTKCPLFSRNWTGKMRNSAFTTLVPLLHVGVRTVR